MLIEVKRYERSTNGKAAIGRVYLDGQYECFSLEDAVREIPGAPVEQWKIDGSTAIPTGTYMLVIDQSLRFSQIASVRAKRAVSIYTPHILDVPGFAGIRQHPGNTDIDTEGCQLLGVVHAQGLDFVGGSTTAYFAYLEKLELAMGLTRIYDGTEYAPGLNFLDVPFHYSESPSTTFTIIVTNEFDLTGGEQ